MYTCAALTPSVFFTWSIGHCIVTYRLNIWYGFAFTRFLTRTMEASSKLLRHSWSQSLSISSDLGSCTRSIVAVLLWSDSLLSPEGGRVASPTRGHAVVWRCFSRFLTWLAIRLRVISSSQPLNEPRAGSYLKSGISFA